MARRIRWVYLIGSPDARPVKIGTSFVPKERLTVLQAGSPLPLRLLWTTQAPRALEKSLHEYFAPYRIHGEWFDFGEEDPIPLVIAAAARMGFWTKPERVQGEPQFVSQDERRERWWAEHGDEPCDSPPATSNDRPDPPASEPSTYVPPPVWPPLPVTDSAQLDYPGEQNGLEWAQQRAHVPVHACAQDQRSVKSQEGDVPWPTPMSLDS